MPKKGKKGGKKGGKGKGKGKGKSGKKGKDDKKKRKNENVTRMAAVNSSIWEARLEVTEKSRTEYREAARSLADQNSSLQDLMQRTEKDTIDVITFLKKQDQEKDDEIYKQNEAMKELKRQHRKEKEAIIADLSHQITQLEEQLAQKTNDVHMMQNELKMVKEFRRKRAQMQKELDEIKEALFIANKEHKNTLGRMEQKFFEEKMRLQQEANQKISELAERAHLEAIANLDETTRSVYKENVRVNEALGYHMREGEQLKKKVESLGEENARLLADKELTDRMVREKVAESKRQKQQVKDLEKKVEILESSLSHAVKEFERDKVGMDLRHTTESESITKELAKLQRLLELKSRESMRVKMLARRVLEQRSEMESFFLESLDHVRREISANQKQYLKDARVAYGRRMLMAHTGKDEYPAIRTFHKSDVSTNSVFRDLEAAERLKNEEMEYRMATSDRVDITELTWEQKERVLRYLFARMNGGSGEPGKPALPAITQADVEEQLDKELVKDSLFITQSDTAGVNLPPIVDDLVVT